MFKASIALVIFAFGALIYGWVQDIDSLLYGSIAFSALAGVFLLRSTLVERKKQALARKAGKQTGLEDPSDLEGLDRFEGSVLRGSSRTSLAELGRRRPETDALSDSPRTRVPLRPFGDSAPPRPTYPIDDFGPDVEGDDLVERTLNWVDASSEDDFDEPLEPVRSKPIADPTYANPTYASRRVEPARRAEPRRGGSTPNDEFRARLASVLGGDTEVETPIAPPPQQQKNLGEQKDLGEQVEADWIRIEDVSSISRATRKDGGYARPEVPAVQPPKRNAAPSGAVAKAAAPRKPAEPVTPRRRTAPARPATAKVVQPKTSAARSRTTPSKAQVKPPPGETGDGTTAPGRRPRPKA